MSQTKDRAQPARTTIVGGQPPGNAREMPPIPVALEELLGMAAATPDFAEALLKDPHGAAAAADLKLTGTERAILRAIDGQQMRLMVDEVRDQLPDSDRRAFFEQAALAVAVLVGGAAAAAAGCAPKNRSRPAGEAGDKSMDTDSPMDPATSQADAATPVMQRQRPEIHAPTKGIRPKRPRPKTPDPGPTTGSRPRRRKRSMRQGMKERDTPARSRHHPPPTFGQRSPNRKPPLPAEPLEDPKTKG